MHRPGPAGRGAGGRTGSDFLRENDLLDVKIESLHRCLQRITEHTPDSAKALSEDYDAQDIVSVNLQRAIQICVDVGGHLISERGWTAPYTMAETFTTLAEHGALDDQLAAAVVGAFDDENGPPTGTK